MKKFYVWLKDGKIIPVLADYFIQLATMDGKVNYQFYDVTGKMVATFFFDEVRCISNEIGG